ncbi:MAG: omptin family outer membrane protease [Desulfobulbus sp.]
MYSSSSGFRDLVWTEYTHNHGITYEQWWYVPYAGIGLRSIVGLWDISGRVYGSPFVQGNDEDYHHNRDLFFEDDFDQSTMYGADLAVTYPISNKWGITGAVKYQHYDEAKGATTMTDTITGEQEFFDGDVAGGDNELLLLTLSVCYQF